MITTALHLAAVLLASLSVGTTAHSLISDAPDRAGRSATDRGITTAVPRYAALGWLVVAVISAAAVDVSDGTGARVAWVFSALGAAATAAFAWSARSWQARFAGVALGCAAAAAPATVGTLAHGVGRDRTGVFGLMLAVALPVLIGAAVAQLGHTRFGRNNKFSGSGDGATGPASVIARRHLVLSWVCLAVLGYSVIGIVAITMRGSWTSTWGALSAASIAALAVAGLATTAAHAVARRPHPHAGRWPIAVQVLALIALAVTTTAMMHADRPASGALSVQQQMIGFDVPGEWTWSQLVTNWRVDALFGPIVVLMVVAYLEGVRRIHARGDAWPIGRTVSWLIGCLGVAVITCTGVNRYAYGQFTVHMILHMGLNLFIPALLVMGGAVTLALRVLPSHRNGRTHAAHASQSADGSGRARAGSGPATLPGPREWIMALVHARFTRLLCNPLVAITVYIVTLYGLYFSGIFDWAVRAPWGHEWMTAHFLITGYLFYWPIVGIDPGPKRLPHVGRLGVLFAIMPFHAFFGIAVMSMSGALGDTFYSALGILGPAAIDHQQTVAGGIAWASGELPLLMVFLSLAVQWGRSDQRTAARHDRQADRYGDDELDSYNAMLKELQDQRR